MYLKDYSLYTYLVTYFSSMPTDFLLNAYMLFFSELIVSSASNKISESLVLRDRTLAYNGHTILKTPVLSHSLQLSNIGSG